MQRFLLYEQQMRQETTNKIFSTNFKMEICLPYWAITSLWNIFLERKDLIFFHLTGGYSQLTILLLVRQHSPKEKEERNMWDYQ